MEPQQCRHLMAVVVCSLKPVKLLGPCKRTQHCWPTTATNVGSCWHFLRPFAWALKDHCKRTQHCWVQHVASVCMEPQQCWHLLTLVSCSLKPVKLLGPCKRQTDATLLAKNPQQHATMLRHFASACMGLNTVGATILCCVSAVYQNKTKWRSKQKSKTNLFII